MKRFAFILFGLALLAPESASALSRSTKVESDMQALMLGLKTFEAANGRLPTAAEGLHALTSNPDPANLPNWRQFALWVPDDPWGHPYQYVAQRSDGGFGIYSLGRDGVSRSGGNDPDDVNTWNRTSGDKRPIPSPVVIYAALTIVIAILIWLFRRRKR